MVYWFTANSARAFFTRCENLRASSTIHPCSRPSIARGGIKSAPTPNAAAGIALLTAVGAGALPVEGRAGRATVKA